MDRFLSIYLNDQLAMGIAWRELARRSQKANKGTEAGDALARVATGIAEDVETFQLIMRRLDIRRNPVKSVLTGLAERAGRLKPNGRLTSYSPLSRFEELEFLIMGIEGKKQLWDTLGRLAGLSSRLPDIDFARLIERASEQRALLEPHRVRAGADAFHE
ncbi:hypothetical protein [Amycolatopsis regifaucium]|uniref:Uncharacterized protein n=1 Tax=Amycolatopsis regifaucium TaxID=546365 RepID=A0A154MH50_9PSEU|nr:hypothetical protein [Amycolatopsis regifaucium]KZB83752.1 hypothetical protein AVL48_34705 [Amycolatopsis regifaucium]OKA06808.1 hypothetical protein ATP06_0219925 [Amycolatopsis regifaucium]SFH27199.1 hypothetical protein SAMN04489731_103271 [Amycolatopsis regifaucium]